VDLPKYSGGRYGLEDVKFLWRCTRRHITDSELVIMSSPEFIGAIRGWAPDETLRALEFEGHGIGGWTPILEVFRGDLHNGKDPNERVILVGLDTIFVRNSDWLFEWDEAPFSLPCSPCRRPKAAPCNAVVTYNAEGAELMWKYYLKAVDKGNPGFSKMSGVPSEMTLMRAFLKENKWPLFQKPSDEPPPMISYSHHHRVINSGRTIPEGCTVVYFHGAKKPRNLPKDSILRAHIEGDPP
jgi:hypothetical protein